MSAILCEGRFDSSQIVRPLLPGERLPFYSTAELLLGVCHFVPAAVKKVPTLEEKEKAQRDRSVYEKTWAGRRVQVDKFRAKHLPGIKAMLAQRATNIAIQKALKISKNPLKRIIDDDMELSALAAARGHFSARSQASKDNFRVNEEAIRVSMKERGLCVTAQKFGFTGNTLKRLLAETA